MPIASSDLVVKYSVATGPGNSAAGTQAGSLGGFISTTPVPDSTLDNIFGDISGDENAAEEVDYRCLFIHNMNSTLTLQNAVVWIENDVAGGATTAIATDSIGVTSLTSASAQASTDSSETGAPTGTSAFSAPATKQTGLSLGNIPPGSVAAFWIQRTAQNTAAQNNDGFTIRVDGDTAA